MVKQFLRGQGERDGVHGLKICWYTLYTLENYITPLTVLVLLDYFHKLEIEESLKYSPHKNFDFLVKFWREFRPILWLVLAFVFLKFF